MRISILPISSLGRWSVGLATAFILLSISLAVLTGLGGMGPGAVAFIIIATIAFGISGMAALIIGVISIIKSKERAILVFLAVLVGFNALFFVLGEFLFPH